jgi:hypothetical protein
LFVSAGALPFAFNLAIALAVLLLVFAIVVVAPVVATITPAPPPLATLVQGSALAAHVIPSNVATINAVTFIEHLLFHTRELALIRAGSKYRPF